MRIPPLRSSSLRRNVNACFFMWSAPVVAARIETGGPTSSGPTTGAPMSSAPTSSERIMQTRAPTFDESGAGGRSGTIATLSTALTILLAILMR